jgi:hypothetical protein
VRARFGPAPDGPPPANNREGRDHLAPALSINVWLKEPLSSDLQLR